MDEIDERELSISPEDIDFIYRHSSITGKMEPQRKKIKSETTRRNDSIRTQGASYSPAIKRETNNNNIEEYTAVISRIPNSYIHYEHRPVKKEEVEYGVEPIHADEEEPVFVPKQEASWEGRLPRAGTPQFPKRFQDVLHLMDDLIERESADDSFWEDLYNHSRHGDRKGIKTRATLRKLKEKGELSWHRAKGEWCPETTNDLRDFIGTLMDIADRWS